MQTDVFTLPRQWPTPYDEKAADLLVERIGERGAASNHLLQDPASLAMIRSLGGNSPYLADLAIREFSALAAAGRQTGRPRSSVPRWMICGRSAAQRA